MRHHGSPYYYTFESDVVLTPERVQCVMVEQILITRLFQDIMISKDERLDPLWNFFQLILQPNGH